jgi:membrane protein YdbS with pleckstrin-like domain
LFHSLFKARANNNSIKTLSSFYAILEALLFVGAVLFVHLSNVVYKVDVALSICFAVLFGISLLFTLILPYFRYKLFFWGYDDRTIAVKQGVIFRKSVVIPVCQIQDLHRLEGPIMQLMKLSGVTISTAGSNFHLSTLTTAEADRMIEELEELLAKRIEEQKNEKI